MTPQLPRQLELNLTALSRSFRQALRFAIKTDPQGAEESSPAWKTVAARQAMLLTMLDAAGPFLRPMLPLAKVAEALPEPGPEPESAVVPPQAPLIEAVNEAPVRETRLTRDSSDEEFLATLPADIQSLHHKIIALEQAPAHTRQEKRRHHRELQDLQAQLEKRYHHWRSTNLLPRSG